MGDPVSRVAIAGDEPTEPAAPPPAVLDALSPTRAIAMGMCGATVGAVPGCLCQGDWTRCIAIQVFGDLAVAGIRNLYERGFAVIPKES